MHVHRVCSLPPIFHGDPRDYAWGADGLDNAITQVSPCCCMLCPVISSHLVQLHVTDVLMLTAITSIGKQ